MRKQHHWFREISAQLKEKIGKRNLLLQRQLWPSRSEDRQRYVLHRRVVNSVSEKPIMEKAGEVEVQMLFRGLRDTWKSAREL